MGKLFSGNRWLPDPALLQLKGLEQEKGRWTVEAAGPTQAPCPACQTVSVSRHSSYWRTLQDLPAQGAAVTLKICVSRWRCRNARCATRFFGTPLPGVATAYQRRTRRVHDLLLWIGHALGGRPAERLAHRLGLLVSDDTILRQLKQETRESVTVNARVIGIDDWAQKKGQNYGTIMVNLETHCVVDLLAERSTEVITRWLAAHPAIAVIARDRNGRYAQAARQAAPQAIQVADRFHLVQNLREAVERELSIVRESLAVTLAPQPPLSEVGSVEEPKAERIRTTSEAWVRDGEIQKQKWQNKGDLFETIQQMKTAGLKVSQMAARLGLNRRRISKWAKLSQLPERSRQEPRADSLESFREYLHQRWQQGCREGRTLWREIRERGYNGCYSRLAKLLAPWRQRRDKKETPISPSPFSGGTSEKKVAVGPASKAVSNLPLIRQISPQVAAALLCQSRSHLTGYQGEIVDQLKRDCPGFATMRTMALSFRTILQHGQVETLRCWMQQTRDSGIQGLRRFAQRLKQDQSAVEAAVRENWSNGPVEGHVNRLKLLKRQMYGRAGVELLRARLLPIADLAAFSLQQK